MEALARRFGEQCSEMYFKNAVRAEVREGPPARPSPATPGGGLGPRPWQISADGAGGVVGSFWVELRTPYAACCAETFAAPRGWAFLQDAAFVSAESGM